MQVSGGDIHVHQHMYSTQEANAVQNSARRFLGPKVPVSEIRQDQLLKLHQVRGDATAKAGDLGIIEEVSPRPAKLVFSNEDAKRKILEQAHPFDPLFLVDIEIKTSE